MIKKVNVQKFEIAVCLKSLCNNLVRAGKILSLGYKIFYLPDSNLHSNHFALVLFLLCRFSR